MKIVPSKLGAKPFQFLQVTSIFSHSVIAGTHIHECCQPGKLDVNNLIVTGAYVLITLLQIVMFIYSCLRKSKVETSDSVEVH